MLGPMISRVFFSGLIGSTCILHLFLHLIDNYSFDYGDMDSSAVTPIAFKYSSCGGFSGLANCLIPPIVTSMIEANLVVIIKAVSFFVRRRTQPGRVQSLA